MAQGASGEGVAGRSDPFADLDAPALSTFQQQGSVVGIWSVAICSLVRVFGAATDCRHLSFAGPRPSGKVRSFAPQTDMFATTRQICRSPLVLSVGRAERRKHPSAIGFLLSEDHGLFSRQSQCTHLRIPRPPLLGGAVPRCPRSPVQWCKHRLQCPFRCRFFAPSSANSTTRRRRVV